MHDLMTRDLFLMKDIVTVRLQRWMYNKYDDWLLLNSQNGRWREPLNHRYAQDTKYVYKENLLVTSYVRSG